MTTRAKAVRQSGNPPRNMKANYVQIGEDRAFRVELFRQAVKRLPVQIFINEVVNGYSIRDGSLMLIWADDLPLGGATELVSNLAKVFTPENQRLLEESFALKDKMHMYHLRNGMDVSDGYTLCNSMWLARGELVTVDMQLSFGSVGRIYSLVIKSMEIPRSVRRER